MKAKRHLSTALAGFTLVEILVSLAVLSILMVVTVSSIESMQRSWKAARVHVEKFRAARTAFETITRNLSQATLNSYWDYYYAETQSNVPGSSGTSTPKAYARQSELHFWCGSTKEILGGDASQAERPGHALFFQAPLGQSQSYRGLTGLLNARGYYLQFGGDQDRQPGFLPLAASKVRYRYRLMEYRPPAEQGMDGLPGNRVYDKPDFWCREELARCSRVIADNIVLMIVMPLVPRESLSVAGQNPWWIAPAYRYDSKDCDNSTPARERLTIDTQGKVRQGTQHLLPPQVRFTLMALDEESARRWVEMTQNKPVDLPKESGALFADAASYQTDLDLVKKYFQTRGINHRVFTEVVTLRNARWDSRAF